MMNRFALVALAVAAAISLPAFAESENSESKAAQDFAKIWEKRCAKGRGADDYPDWQFIANNARRTADDYATKRKPDAIFATAKVEAVFQLAGEHVGEYLVILVSEGPLGTSLAVLKPNFKFCADPSSLDDGRSDLFSVVQAKFNGIHF
jgi:hypothetical protein